MAWTSSFGDGSFARHVALGCAPLEIPDASTLRRDVDTAAQLEAARALGLGPRTAALLRADRRPHSRPRPRHGLAASAFAGHELRHPARRPHDS